MTSIEGFYFRYRANRLPREGYITPREQQGLLSANLLFSETQAKHANASFVHLL